MLSTPLRVPLLAVAAGLALAYAATAAWPVRFAATASVLLPEVSGARSRLLRIEDMADDARTALLRVEEQVKVHVGRKAQMVDAPRVRPQRPSLPLNLALGGAAGLALGVAYAAGRMRRPPARRISPWSTLSLCEQLRRQWFTPERAMLAVVSTAPGEASARLAAQLATAFADLGHRTLLIDGDMRSPALHRELGLDNSGGLAGLLERGRVDLARVNDNLSVIVAGRPKGDPLELLTHRRLRAFLADARQHFSIVLMHAPSAAAARDYEMFAALAGGALVMGDAQRLQPSLERCGAQVAAAVGY